MIAVMRPNFDVRTWNLFFGFTLAAGCSSRPLSLDSETGDDDGSSGSSDVTTATTSPTSQTTTTDDSGECQSDAECPPGYYCLDGVCEYLVAPDGHWYECYSDDQCDSLELCRYSYCQLQMSPPECQTPAAQLIPLPLPDTALALSFADVDDDGAEELVVASEMQLHVLEHGGMGPTSSPRGIGSPSILDMAAGELDGQPGEDLAILHVGNERLVHASDGMGGFAPASAESLPLMAATGLIVERFDGGGPIDGVLSWGHDGAALELDGQIQLLENEPIFGGAYRDPATGVGGFSLRASGQLLFYELGGGLITTTWSEYIEPIGALTSIVTYGEPIDVTGDRMDSAQPWTLLSHYLAASYNFAAQWGVPLVVSEMKGADLRGDMYDELVLIADGQLWIYREVGYLPEECLVLVELPEPVVEIAIGDHDGDGDDEIGVRLESGAVGVLDDEG